MAIGMIFESHQKTISAHEQILGLLELADSRGLHRDKLLRGTGLFAQDLFAAPEQGVAAEAVLMSAAQLRRVLDNASRLLPRDSSFLYGQYLLPGNQSAFSRAMLAASNAQEALSLLADFGSLAMPLLSFKLHYSEHDCVLQLVCVDGDDYRFPFMIEAALTSIISACDWLGGRAMPWRFQLAYSKANCLEQYQVHLGADTCFDAHMNALIIPREQLHLAWPRGSVAQLALARQQILDLSMAQPLPSRVYARLAQEIHLPPSLEVLAAQWQMSPATFKRKLKTWACSYQSLLDTARRHAAIYSMRHQGLSAEQTAAQLNYHDKHNFKRSFKRWTGLSPAAYFRA